MVDRVMTDEETAAAFGTARPAGGTPTATVPDWRERVAYLLSEAGRYVRPGHLGRPTIGLIVRVRETAPFPDYGPGAVVEHRPDAEPDWRAPFGDVRYGKRAEYRVLFKPATMLLPLWLEGSDLEPWPERYEPAPAEAQKTQD